MGGDSPRAPHFKIQISQILVHPPKNSTRSDFDEIWAIYVNLHKKNNEIGQNDLGVHVRGACGAVVPI